MFALQPRKKGQHYAINLLFFTAVEKNKFFIIFMVYGDFY